MKILLLGATGRTGKHVIEEALKKGHEISAIARQPEKLSGYPIHVTRGTPYDYATVEKAITGCKAVINTLNISRQSDNPWASLRSPDDLISRSAGNALRAMQQAGVKRIVVLGTIGAGRSWKKSPAILRFMVSMSNLKYAFRDHGRQEDILEKSGAEYTICRAPMLSDKRNENGAVATAEEARPASMTLSRNTAAEFMIEIIEKNTHLRETISVSNRPAGNN